MKTLPEYSAEGKEEFNGCYGDFFTESLECKGCKNSFEGDTRHRRHCIVDVNEWLESHDRALIETFMKEVMPEEDERAVDHDRNIVTESRRVLWGMFAQGWNFCRQEILTRAQEFLGESKV